MKNHLETFNLTIWTEKRENKYVLSPSFWQDGDAKNEKRDFTEAMFKRKLSLEVKHAESSESAQGV